MNSNSQKENEEVIFKKIKIAFEKLRSKDGCPWDKKQTHKSIRYFFLEEVYETIDAITREDNDHLCEELGDIMLLIFLHGQIAQDGNNFNIYDVAKSCYDKIIRRHPHVFAEAEAKNEDDVKVIWAKAKLAEGKVDSDDEFKMFPSLIAAEKLQKMASKIGYDWEDSGEVIKKIYEELEEVKEEIKAFSSIKNTDKSILSKKEKLTEELGDLLFTIVNLSRKLEVNAENALIISNNKFNRRINWIKNDWKVKNEGKLSDIEDIKKLSNKEKIKYWEKSKERTDQK